MNKVQENKLRRVVKRRGFLLKKSRRKDKGAADYGSYWLVDENNCLVAGGEFGLFFDDVVTWIKDLDMKNKRTKKRTRILA